MKFSFFSDIESAGKMTHFESHGAGLNSKYLHFLWKDSMSKNKTDTNEIFVWLIDFFLVWNSNETTILI